MIRIATVQDAEAIARVQTEAWQAAYQGLVPDDILNELDIRERTERWVAILKESASRTYVHDSGGSIAAWMSIGPNRDGRGVGCGEVWALYVSPSRWGQGLGSSMMDFGMEIARQSGWDEIVLWVLKENHAARAFYERVGLVRDGSEKRIQFCGAWLDEVRYHQPVAAACPN